MRKTGSDETWLGSCEFGKYLWARPVEPQGIVLHLEWLRMTGQYIGGFEGAACRRYCDQCREAPQNGEPPMSFTCSSS